MMSLTGRSLSQTSQKSHHDISSQSSQLQSIQDDVNAYLGNTFSQMYETYPGTDHDEFDIRAERANDQATSLKQTLSYLIKGSLGIGILGMDEAFMHGGLWTSLGLSFFIAILVYYTAWMLVTSAQKMYRRLRIPRLSYPDLAEQAALGVASERHSRYFRYTVEIVLFTAQTFTCSFCQIIIAATIKQVWEQKAKSYYPSFMEQDLNIYILIMTLPLLCLCLIRKLRYLALFSFFADLAIVTCIAVTVYISIKTILKGVPERRGWNNWTGLFKFCGCFIYAIDGVTTLLPIENHMRDPAQFLSLFQISSTIALVTAVLVGALGYMAWGDECITPMTFLLPSDELIFVIFKTVLALMLNVTFAMHFWVQFRIPWHYIAQKYTDHPQRRCIERLCRTFNLMAITVLSIIVPDLYRSMSSLGAFLLAFTGLLFPAVIETMVSWKEHERGVRWLLIKNIALVLFGLFLTSAIVYSNA